MNALIPFTADTNARVRLQTTDIIYLASYKSTDYSLRQKTVQFLVIGCGDKESGNAGRAGKYLTHYKKDDFNSISKDSLAAFIKRGAYYLDNVLKLAGYLNMISTIPDIKAIINSPNYDEKTKWAAHLSQARMGDKTETEYCLRRHGCIYKSILWNVVN